MLPCCNTGIGKHVEYVYLLQLREFVQSGEPVYKIGRTSQENTKRFAQYPKGSTLLLQRTCANSRQAETKIKAYFKVKYEQMREYGVEYFRGDAAKMLNDINRIVSALIPDSAVPAGIASIKRPPRPELNIFGQIDTRETVPMDVVE